MYETHVTVQGRLVADPVVKQGRAGAFTVFRVAQSERHQDRAEPGRWTDSEPSYYDVTAYRTMGENAQRSLRKGHPVVVRGRQRVRQFRRDDGSSGAVVEILADALGHDLRWGSTSYTRNGDLAPALPDASTAFGDPLHDAYDVVGDEYGRRAPVGAGAASAPAAVVHGPGPDGGAGEGPRPDTGPLVPPAREDAA
ncbi:single-stranded DNA-binding protein [Arthrobacter sp. NEB 688]|uniref:single-stranded DNA-binding protein n=1 Tax=Arthrobacter sp. NEB 688 TaxID=904039 RepID=UPI001565BB0D|nr:single-stranded DNA-binding protein [Arthrobacter sp. NEB 688]QKE85388.1 single-stranded DNA-binding protein [Arthrobacter sp. NEB 688]